MKRNSVITLVILILCLVGLAVNGLAALADFGRVEEAAAVTNTPMLTYKDPAFAENGAGSKFVYNDDDVVVQSAKCTNTVYTLDQMFSQAVDQIYELDGVGGTLKTGFFVNTKSEIMKLANTLSTMRGVENVRVDEVNRYSNGSYYMVYITTANNFRFFYALDYGDESKLSQEDRQTIAKLREIVSEARVYDNVYDKEKFFHNYLVKNVTYGIAPKGLAGQTPYEVLILGAGFSAGYAYTFDLLLKMAGIPSRIVSGTATTAEGSGAHVWNQVQIDGKWYNVDVTWDDAASDDTDYVDYTYFNGSDAFFNQTHQAAATDGTECNSTDLYGILKEYKELKSQEEVLSFVKESYSEENKTVEFRYSCQDEICIQSLVNELMKGATYRAVASSYGTVYRITFE